MKAISLITRRADICRDTFRQYYEDTHCRLAMRYFPYKRYTRNYLQAEVAGLDFDCISEFQMAADFDSRNIMNSRSRKLLLDDERQFMQPERIRVAMAEETILLDRQLEGTQGPVSRYALLFVRGGMTALEFQCLVATSAQSLSRDVDAVHSVSMDMLRPLAADDFPFDAVVWLQLASPSKTHLVPCGMLPGILGTIAVHTHATSAQELQQRHEAYLP